MITMVEKKNRVRIFVFGTLAVLILGLGAPSAWALGPGAPPVVTFAAVWVNSDPFRFGGNPQLTANVQVEIPGGNVPINVQSVKVTVPGIAAPFTMPLQRLDLAPEEAYVLNLTQAGVVGFPSGTYTFTVTDSSSGVTNANDTLTAPGTPLAPTSAISVSGTTQIPSPSEETGFPPGLTYPPTFTLDLSANPTPTVTWNAVAGAALYRLVIQAGGLDQPDHEVFARETTATSMIMPGGVMVPGRRYHVQVAAFDNSGGLPAANSSSRNDIEILTLGPTIYLTFGQGTYSAGQTLNVTSRIYNTGPTVTVDARAWIGVPNGLVIEILDMKGLTISNSVGNPTGPNNFYSGSIGFSYMFDSFEPNGVYVVGMTLIDPATHQIVAQTSRTFQH